MSQVIIKAKVHQTKLKETVEVRRTALKELAPENTLPSIAVFIRHEMVQARKNQKHTHNKKSLTLSEEQQRPLFTVRNTVVAHNLNVEPPSYVIETLSLGPKNAVLDRFDAKDVMAELDGLLYFCKNNNVSEELITDINVKTLEYIKRCKKMKTSRNLISSTAL